MRRAFFKKNVAFVKIECIFADVAEFGLADKRKHIKKHTTMITPLLIGTLGTPEIIIIALVVLLLFGGKKIPELMKGIGKGVKSFKQGMNEVEKEINDIDANADEKKEK